MGRAADLAKLDAGLSSQWALRNKLINGDFSVWQRGTSLPSGTERRYCADRWAVDSVGSTCAVSRQALAAGTIPGDPEFFLRTTVASVAGASNLAVHTQRIEDVRTLAGKTAVLSFWAKADAAKNIAIELEQHFGSGGSAPVSAIGAQLVALTTAWAKYSVRVSVPAVTGKTIGAGSNLDLLFWFDAGSTHAARAAGLGQQSGTFDIARVQLEEGDVVTPFEQRPAQIELALCQRYFEKSYDVDVPPGTAYDLGAYSSIAKNPAWLFTPNVTFRVSKRAAPIITLYSNATGAAGKVHNLTTTTDLAVSLGSALGPSENGFQAFFGLTTLTTDNQYVFHWAADAEL